MFEICLILLSGVSPFLTVWRSDCCKVFLFAPSFCVTFFHIRHCCACLFWAMCLP